MEFESVIGLEVHAELSTKSKAYCSCRNKFGSPPNTNCCPVCMGFPGALPALNREVVNFAIRAGLALNCKIRKVSKQDRKNYFYPDLGKAYQITQYDLPLCYDGYLDIVVKGEARRIGIRRIHIEEDAGKLIHDKTNGSLLDFNRAGVPLIEIVTEPMLHSPAEAKVFMETLREILIYIEVTDGRMQEGSIRCDVNVSIREKGAAELGIRCEMKNINTFSGAERAIVYEANRQKALILAGGKIEQETRRWDDEAGINYAMRTKESAKDYRYFPEANVAPIVVSDEWIESIRVKIPELPSIKKCRYVKEWGLEDSAADNLTASKSFAEYFEKIVSLGADPKEACNWCLGEISRIIKEQGLDYKAIPVSPEDLAKLIALVQNGRISGSAGKKILQKMFETKEPPEKLVAKMGLGQINDESALKTLIEDTIKENSKSVGDYKSGKQQVVGFLIGQIMKKSGGKANPQLVSRILKDTLERI